MIPRAHTRFILPSRPLRALCVPFFACSCLRFPAAEPQTLPHIRQTHTLTCALDQGTPDFTTLDPHGPRLAFDLELCHAVAVAIAGPDAKVLPIPLPDEASTLTALLEHKADLVPTASLNLTNSTRPGLFLGPPILLDATGLLVPTTVPSAQSLSGKKICFFAETETETTLHTWSNRIHFDLVPYPFSEEGEMQAALMTGNCPAVAGDLTRLAAMRESLGATATRYKLLPDALSQDPLGPAAADPDLLHIATWVFQLLLNADALNVTRATLPAALASKDPAIQRLLGRTHELGPRLGLDDAWSIRVLTAIGSFSDLSLRTLAPSLPPSVIPPPLPLH